MLKLHLSFLKYSSCMYGYLRHVRFHSVLLSVPVDGNPGNNDNKISAQPLFIIDYIYRVFKGN